MCVKRKRWNERVKEYLFALYFSRSRHRYHSLYAVSFCSMYVCVIFFFVICMCMSATHIVNNATITRLLHCKAFHVPSFSFSSISNLILYHFFFFSKFFGYYFAFLQSFRYFFFLLSYFLLFLCLPFASRYYCNISEHSINSLLTIAVCLTFMIQMVFFHFVKHIQFLAAFDSHLNTLLYI